MRYLVVLLLAGCAMSPADLRQHGERVEFNSSGSPRTTAPCIARNADNYKPGGGLAGPFPANVRDGLKAGAYEVVAQHAGGGFGFVMVADVEPREGGALVTTWLTRDLIYRDMPDRIVEPCGAQRLTPKRAPPPAYRGQRTQ